MSTPCIEVKNVRREFRSVKKSEGAKGLLELLLKPQYAVHEALKGVSFSIERGAFIGLIGANGAGKTTLLKILSGLIPTTSGTASVLGFDPFKRPMEFRRQISLVMGQKAQLWWDLPARDAFDLLQAIYDIPKDVYKKRVTDLSAMLNVEKMLQTQIRRLSLGERMKMELIGALIHSPSVIFLDEPTIGLDVVAAANLREFLRDFNRKQLATIILTSHNMDDIEKLCSRVLILKEGTMVYDGKPQGLVQSDERRLRMSFRNAVTQDQLAQAAGLATDVVSQNCDDDAAPNTYCLKIKREQMSSVLSKVFEKFEVNDIGVEQQSLEDVIGHLFQNKT